MNQFAVTNPKFEIALRGLHSLPLLRVVGCC